MRILFAVLRLAVAGLTIAAIVAQLLRTISVWTKAGVDDLSQLFVNFFSFFTIESNVLAVVTLLIGAVLILTRKPTEPRWFGILRGTAVTYMTVTFVVYNLLLRNVELPQGSTVPWSNEVLHVVAPLWMIVDWIFAPGRRELVWRTIWIVVAFPIVWVIYTLIRGPITTNALTGDPYWYPYPFLNPNISENGYLSVAFYVILIAMVICVTAAGVVWVSRRKAILKD